MSEESVEYRRANFLWWRAETPFPVPNFDWEYEFSAIRIINGTWVVYRFTQKHYPTWATFSTDTIPNRLRYKVFELSITRQKFLKVFIKVFSWKFSSRKLCIPNPITGLLNLTTWVKKPTVPGYKKLYILNMAILWFLMDIGKM